MASWAGVHGTSCHGGKNIKENYETSHYFVDIIYEREREREREREI